MHVGLLKLSQLLFCYPYSSNDSMCAGPSFHVFLITFRDYSLTTGMIMFSCA